MIVELPVRHRVSVVPTRRRRPIPCWRTETVAFLVPETDGASAPVALEACVDPRRNTPPVAVRVHGGRFWAPLVEGRGSGLRDRIKALVAVASPQEEAARHVGYAVQHSFVQPRVREAVAGTVERTSLPSIRARVGLRIGDEFLVVDGIVHVRARSPVLRIADAAKTFKRGSKRFTRLLSDGAVATWTADPEHVEKLRSAMAGPGGSVVPRTETVLRMLPARIVDAAAAATCADDPAGNFSFAPDVREAANARAVRYGSRRIGGWTTPGRPDETRGVVAWQPLLARRDGENDVVSIRARIAEAGSQVFDRAETPVPDRVAGGARTILVLAGTAAPEWNAHSVGIERIDDADPESVCTIGGAHVVLSQGEFFLGLAEGGPLRRDGADRMPDTTPFHVLGEGVSMPASPSTSGNPAMFVAEQAVDLGGRLYWRCLEPVFLVMTDYTEPHVRLKLDWTGVLGKYDGARDGFVLHLDQAAEAASLARRLFGRPPRVMADVGNIDASLLGASCHRWNLRLALQRWANGLDGRVDFLSDGSKAALAELLALLEDRRRELLALLDGRRDEPTAMADHECDARLLRLHGVMADDMADPFFDDSECGAVIDLARTSAVALRTTTIPGSRRHAVSDDAAEFAGFSM